MSQKTEMKKFDEKNIEKQEKLFEMVPVVDIFENENELLLHAEMPGVEKKEISVNIDNGILSLSGVRKLQTKGSVSLEEFGNVEYVRRFSVPPNIAIDRVEAELKDGVLKLHLPKSEAAKPRKIEIKTA